MRENSYLDLMQDILETGEFIENDRTGVGIYSKFGTMLRFDLTKGFPALTTKKLAWKAVVGELLWFLEGSMNVNRLREITHGPGSSKRTIWDDNYDNQAKTLGYSNGYLGPVYGRQWRDFQGVDQIKQLIKDINKSKESGVHNRRLLVSAWNPPELDKMALPPCHYAFQLYYLNGELSLMFHMRSVDVFLGLPFNIASYALLLHILAQVTGTKAKELIFTGGDTHIYANHFDQCMEQLSREPYTTPELVMPVFTTLEEVLQIPVDCFELENYKSHPTIKAPMAV